MSEFRAALQALVELFMHDRRNNVAVWVGIEACYECQQTKLCAFHGAQALLARADPKERSKLAADLLESVKWLANNAKGMSLLNWDTHSNILLRAAYELDAIHAAHPEPEPRITREEAEKLLREHWNASVYLYRSGQHKKRFDAATEACFAAMVRPEADAVGTIEHRFSTLIDTLQSRLDIPDQPFSSEPPESRIISALDAAVEKTRDWQPIESAPNGKSVLCFWPAVKRNDVNHEAYQGQAWKRFGNWFRTRDGYGAATDMVNDPTHWRPLPSPPAASDGE